MTDPNIQPMQTGTEIVAHIKKGKTKVAESPDKIKGLAIREALHGETSDDQGVDLSNFRWNGNCCCCGREAIKCVGELVAAPMLALFLRLADGSHASNARGSVSPVADSSLDSREPTSFWYTCFFFSF